MGDEVVPFPVGERYLVEDVKAVQSRSLSMAKIIADIFNKNDISYMMAYGTMLGAARERGFVPWDDDLDLFVFEKDYARAIEILRSSLPSWMICHNRLNDPVYWVNWTRVRDVRSYTEESMWQIDSAYRYHGVCIDIHCLKNMTKGEFLFGKKIKNQIALVKRAIHRVSLSFRLPLVLASVLKRTVILLAYCFSALIMPQSLLVANVSSPVECSFRKKDILPLSNYDFEDTMFPGPHDIDEALKSLYGDWRKLPDFEDRHVHYSFVKFFDADSVW